MVLEEFGALSGLQVNQNKSVIFPINLSPEEETALMTQYNYKRNACCLSLLGIIILAHEQDIVKFNHEKVMVNVQQHFGCWKKIHFSWSYRFQLVKFFILPKFIFLFCAIPTFI